MSSRVRQPGPPAPWRSGPVRETGPGYLLRSPLAVSLRARPGRPHPAPDLTRRGGCDAGNNRKDRVGGNNLLIVVISHCATRARSSNPAGPPLRCGLAQEGLRRAVKVADREVGLTRTPQDLVCGAPAPERGAAASARRSQTARRAAGSTQSPARMHHRESLPAPRTGAGAACRTPRMPTRNAAHSRDPAPRLPRPRDAQLPHQDRRLSAPTPA